MSTQKCTSDMSMCMSTVEIKTWKKNRMIILKQKLSFNNFIIITLVKKVNLLILTGCCEEF